MSAALKDILFHVVPALRAWGFKGSGQNFRYANAHSVCVVNFQKSSGGNRFYVNVGLQPLFVPDEVGSKPDPINIHESACIFRQRVEPPDGMFGWPYDLDDSLLQLLCRRFEEKYSSFIKPLMLFPGPLTEATPKDFDGHPVHPLFGGRRARTFLHFSRIALAWNRPDVATEFAQRGIHMCGNRATSLLADLKDALRNASP